MRRKVMIENLIIILRGCYPQYLDDKSNKSVRSDAEYVLDNIERYGMLPLYHRSNKQPISQCHNRQEIQEELEDRSDITFEWEPEDVDSET